MDEWAKGGATADVAPDEAASAEPAAGDEPVAEATAEPSVGDEVDEATDEGAKVEDAAVEVGGDAGEETAP